MILRDTDRMHRPARAGKGDDYPVVYRETAVRDRVRTQQLLSTRVSHLKEIVAVRQTRGAGRCVRSGTAVEIYGALGIVYVRIYSRPVGHRRKDSAADARHQR